MITTARKASSSRGLRMNHSSLVGGRTVRVIEPFGQVLMHEAHRLQFVLLSIVRGNSNSGQPGPFSFPLKHAARLLHVAQTSGVARRVIMPVRA
jgi:hypothetical protein